MDKGADERIINRIRKMLALAKDAGATEGERDNAMRAAHATLAKYNLDLADLEERGQPGERRGAAQAAFYGRPWARQVAFKVAQLFFCQYIYTPAERAKDTKHYFIGKESNSATAIELSKFVIESISKEAKKRARDYGHNGTWTRSFCWGAAMAIKEKVDEIIASSTRIDATPGTAIVLASLYQRESAANRELFDQLFPSRTAGRAGKSTVDSAGRAAGTSYGRTISLHRQISR